MVERVGTKGGGACEEKPGWCALSEEQTYPLDIVRHESAGACCCNTVGTTEIHAATWVSEQRREFSAGESSKEQRDLTMLILKKEKRSN